MKEPSEALEAARRASASEPDSEPLGLEQEFVSARRLAEWAMIEPSPDKVLSTRAYGKPITWLKRLLVRLLGQYLGQMSAQQSRFNSHIAAHVLRLEDRVRELEQAVRERPADEHGEPPREPPADERHQPPR